MTLTRNSAASFAAAKTLLGVPVSQPTRGWGIGLSNPWNTKRNPKQSFTVALQVLIRDAPNEALLKVASSKEMLHGLSSTAARAELKTRGYHRSGKKVVTCGQCGHTVYKLTLFNHQMVCRECRKMLAEQLKIRRNGMGRFGNVRP